MNIFILLAVIACICVNKLGQCSCPVCTDIDQFSHLFNQNGAMAGTFKVFTDFGLLRCVQQCMFRSRCQSINFDVSTKICELNEASPSGMFVRNPSVTTSIADWPRRLAGVCENKNCAAEEVCEIERQADRETVSCVADDISPVDKGYIKATNLPFYYKPYTDTVNYDDASNICHNDGARIIEADSEEKKKCIPGILPKVYPGGDFVFIGAKDVEDVGDWRWVSNNASFSFSDWDQSEPQTKILEYCAAYYQNYDWKWVNLFCYRTEQFICEIHIY